MVVQKFIALFLLFVVVNGGVLKNREDWPVSHEGFVCGEQKCPDDQRCEMPTSDNECGDEDGCSFAPKCVPIPVATPKCGENEELKECGSACEPTCENANPVCAAVCLTNVCQCKKGLIRDADSGKCVEKSSCHKCSLTCDANEKCEVVELNCERGEPCPTTEVSTVASLCSETIKAGVIGPITSVGSVFLIMKFILVLVLCCVALSAAVKTCNENEELVACHNTCEPQCGYTPKACTEQCLMDYCDCKDGFVRNNQGACVDPILCTAATTTCPQNEQLRECGTACEPTCENPKPQFCTKQCLVNVCQCTAPFVRFGLGCIKKEDCPKSEMHAMLFRNARMFRKPTKRILKPMIFTVLIPSVILIATFIYVIVRFEIENNACGLNEQWQECADECRMTCFDHMLKKHCKNSCSPAVLLRNDSRYTWSCHCSDGFVRFGRGLCTSILFFGTFFVVGCLATWIQSVTSLPECQKNEKRVACGYDCEPQCGFSPNICSFECRPNVCVCKDGFVRNTLNECVRRLECTAETSRCPEFEEFTECGSVCQPTCEEPNPTAPCLYKRCVRNTCRCVPGYLRYSGVCVAPEECPAINHRPLEIFSL
ncbi:unnamed protein product [Caenorhabditis sp. 36 PRJEB53466]|nr:unnamed protein product [Caenorhabditis sp. 36 PRJEB53466]